MSQIHCNYIFEFNTPQEQRYDLYFDSTNMSLLEKSFNRQSEVPLEWARLENNQCKHCPLKKEQSPYCPTAVALAKVAAKFSDVKSYKETKVAVITADRTYLKQTSTQEALQSIFGLIMATSGCPHLNFLKPMARFHLPFSNLNETMVRSLSFYFLRNYFKQSSQPDSFTFDLKELTEAYEKLNTVNYHLVERLRSLGKGDADLNAVIILDGFATLMSVQVSENFSDLKPFFTEAAPS